MIFFKREIKFSFAQLVISSMILGVLCGLVFGERCSSLAIVGKAYIALLQMCILPFIITSIIHGIGRLGIDESKALAVKGLSLTLLFWCLMAFYLVIMPFCFPEWQATLFFNPNAVEVVEPIDYVQLYIPTNFFYSLAHTLIPAITVFCICVGVALISVKNKVAILQDLEICCTTLGRVNNGVVKLAPIGTFALLANLAGTMGVDEILRMQVYLVVYGATTLLLVFCTFPLLMTAFTDFKYREVMRAA